MRRIVLFMHTSLDGFVAGPKGEMDWIIVDEAMPELYFEDYHFSLGLYFTNAERYKNKVFEKQ